MKRELVAISFFLQCFILNCVKNEVAGQAPAPTHGVCIGNSTVAKYQGGEAIAALLFTEEEKALGYSCHSLAVPGHTINQQLDAWINYNGKGEADWIIVQIGLNDIQPEDPLDSALIRYNKLIAVINTSKKPGARVILGTMIPCKKRLKNIYKEKWKTSYKKWLAINAAIMGKGKNALSADFRINGHTSALNDGNGNLKQEFQTSRMDHIHENTAGRLIIASYWRLALSALHYL